MYDNVVNKKIKARPADSTKLPKAPESLRCDKACIEFIVLNKIVQW